MTEQHLEAAPASGPHGEPPVDGSPQASGGQELEQPTTSSGEIADVTASDTINWKEHARTWETRAKQNKQTIESLSSEKEQLAQELAETQSRMFQAEAKALKLSIAQEVGLPFDLIPRLVGDNEDELRADAEQLKSLVASVGPVAQGSPVVVPGVSVGGDVPPFDAAAIAAAMP